MGSAAPHFVYCFCCYLQMSLLNNLLSRFTKFQWFSMMSGKDCHKYPKALFWVHLYPPFKHTLIMITQPKLGQHLATLRETSRFCILQSYKTMPTLIVWWVKVDQASDHCCPCKCLLLTRGSSHMERAAYQPLDANKAQSVSGAQPVNYSSYCQTKNIQPEVSLPYKSAWNSLFF